MAKIYGALEVAQLEWFTDAGKPAASSYIYRVIYVSDLKQVMVSDGSNWIPFLNTSTNQTVNGNITFAGQQIFNGLHRLSVTTDSSSTGAVTALNNVTPVIEFTAAVTSISGIVNSASGATVMLVNRTGSTLAILDEDAAATAANRIRTGTGAQVALANNASVILTYVGDNRWHIVGGSGSSTGGSAGINYITNGTAEADTVGWAVYADAAGTSPVDGTGGSANVTITRTTTTPLVGSASFLLAKDAANRQGQGWSYDFTIDLANRAKVLQISFDYLVNSGTFVAGATGSNSDVTVWIYDITNALLIQPSNIKLFSNNASISDKFQASFQTSSNSSNYRLILHVASTSASAYTLEVDSVSVSPSDYVFGTPVTDWQSYTPTFTGFGTPTAISVYWRRVGDSVQLSGTFTAGTSTGTQAQMTLPNGITVDTNKIFSTAIVGTGAFNNVNSAAFVNILASGSNNYVMFGVGGSASYSGGAPQNANVVATSGQTVEFYATIPITGWSSSVQTSDNADTRVVSAVATGLCNTVSAANPITLSSISVSDTHGAYNSSTGRYTVPVPGVYNVKFSIDTGGGAASGNRMWLYKNGVQNAFIGYTYVNGMWGSIDVPCVAGDIIDIRCAVGISSYTVTCSISFTRYSGPSAIAATETVAAKYSGMVASTVSTTAPFQYNTKQFDTHNSVTTGANWRFTAPIAGTYRITAIAALTTGPQDCAIYKNGSLTPSTLFGANATYSLSGSTSIQLIAGDYIDLRPNAGSYTSITASNYSISIEKVGN